MMKWFVLRYKNPIFLGIITFFVLLFCSKDSYLYAQIGQFDSAWFFMCGKALMNGMVPYTDYTDSKGLLLWIVYGLGYLFDHYSYVGIFWLSCITVWLTLCISYRTSRLWLDTNWSVLAASLLLIPLTYWNFYMETKAEHFCWPTVAWGIYVLMSMMQNRPQSLFKFVGIGVGLIVCLMLKWSVALMMLSLVCSIGWWAWRNKEIKPCFVGLSLGGFLAFLPFAIYFTIVGNWSDWVGEYFVNTMSSVSVPLSETMQLYGQEWLAMFSTRRFIYLLYTLPVLLLWQRKDWFATLLPALCGLFFIALSIRHDQFGHYISVVGPFAILTIILALQYCLKWRIRMQYISLGGLVAIVYIIWGSIHFTDSFCTKAGERFDRYMAISAAMAKIDNPTLINIGVEKGLCMGNTLPGTKYWTTQMGRTEEMWRSEVEGINACTADFVIDYSDDPKATERWLTSVGYHRWEECNGIIYTKHALDSVSNIKTISLRDIVFKRTYADIYGDVMLR